MTGKAAGAHKRGGIHVNHKMTRRRFLRSNVATAVGAGLAGRLVRGENSNPTTRPTDSLSVGIIGCGDRGKYLTYVCQIVPGIRVAAICDVNRDRLAKVHQQLGGQADTHHDYRRILSNKSIDAVVIATNAHWHARIAIDACEAGKDIYLEKPVATSIAEGQAIIKAARRYNRLIQMGMQQHSWEHYREAVEIVRSGRLGTVSHVHIWDVENAWPGFGMPPDGPAPPELDWEFWLGPSPLVPYNPNRYTRAEWFFDYDGGWQVAWGAHHFDIVHWAMGVTAPVAATGSGGHFAFKDNREWPDTFNGTCEYPSGPVAKNGFLVTYTMRHGSGRLIEGRAHGKAFHGTDGVLIVDRSGYEVLSENRDGARMVAEEKVASYTRSHDVVQNHVKAFLECVRARRSPEADVLVGHRATNPGHLMNIAWRVGRRVRWEGTTEQVVEDSEAAKWLVKTYRRPWALRES